jgi:hypothetical protein
VNNNTGFYIHKIFLEKLAILLASGQLGDLGVRLRERFTLLYHLNFETGQCIT